MRMDEQGVDTPRYVVVPRTLSFVTCDGALLLLRGSPRKRLWPNQLNGLGGHLEPGETPLEGARREILEEAQLIPEQLDLRALVHISDAGADTGVLLFVYVGSVGARAGRGGDEGALEWHPLDSLPWEEMVPDLREMLPRLFPEREGLLYGLYEAGADGELRFRWGHDLER